VSSATFRYLGQFAWRRVAQWLRKRHPRITWKQLRRRYLSGEPGWRPTEDGIELFYPQQVAITRYRWRAANIPTPWTSLAAALAAA
jgi:RNA-directed DNA polymerase